MNCANGYHPDSNPRGCRYHHQHLDTCENEACTGCLPRQAERGSLCAPCFDRAEANLEALPHQWAQLANHLAPGSAAGQAKVSGSQEQRIGITVPVADHRLRIERVLSDWTDLHAEELRTRPPTDQRNPRVSGPWLETRLDWAARQEWVADYIHELRDLSSRARSLLDPSGRRRITQIGPCPVDDCSGTLTATVRPAEYLPTSLACDVDSAHMYTTGDWRTLGRKLGKLAS